MRLYSSLYGCSVLAVLEESSGSGQHLRIPVRTVFPRQPFGHWGHRRRFVVHFKNCLQLQSRFVSLYLQKARAGRFLWRL